MGAEIDLVEEKESRYFGYEFKWGDKQAKTPASWQAGYPDGVFTTVNRTNYLSFITNNK